ncbi:DUF2459 domain-containing protein [Paraburkholderia guartelaensis]|uniref:DUF2459 domain-containing protein n=1 Tax=Paraburkholderia guartelaensis TaxID=2546446 RepID=A0A4R5LDL6_9BURK|nr:DUF2459 domain-containing protein [Paraburkholderia guartelaensis]TDG06229.1 DUF2459 domain-containing protein [Paraburkholderia guartelaensis]
MTETTCVNERPTKTTAWQALCAFVLASALGACANMHGPLPAAIGPVADGPTRTSVAVVQRDWHTDICLRVHDVDVWVDALALGFDDATVLCFGFGERQFVVERRHDPLTMIGALMPSQATVLMTALRAAPEAAFGPQNVLEVPVDDAGLASVQRYLRASLETNAAGTPQRLADGPYTGSVYFAASGTYDALHTCNTWTARAVRSAGLNDVPDVLFASSLMREVRHALETKAPDGATRSAAASQ